MRLVLEGLLSLKKNFLFNAQKDIPLIYAQYALLLIMINTKEYLILDVKNALKSQQISLELLVLA